MVTKRHVYIFSIAFLSVLAACEDVNSPVNPAGAKASFASGVTTDGTVAAVRVTLAYDTVQIGDTLRWTADAVDANGQIVTSGVTYHWGNPGGDLFGYVAKSGNTAKAVARIAGKDTAVMTVTVSGAKFKGYGYVLITAAGTKPASGDSTPTAPAASVKSVSVTLNPASLAVGQTSQATATARDSAGQAITGRTVTWSSNNTSVATVSGSGLVNGLAAGSAKISAAIDGITGSADITVTAPTTQPPTTSYPGDAVVLAPGQDIQSAVSAHPAGTTFRLTAGVYRNQHVVPKSGDTFVGDAGAVLDGGNATAYAFDKGSAPYPSKVTIKGLEIRAYASADHMGPILAGGGSASEGTYGWVVDGVDVHNNRVGGVRVGHHTIVRNSKFHHNGWFGLSGAGDSVLVENNEISYNNVPGTPGTVQCDPNWGGGGFKFVYTRWLVVRNNFSHHNSGAGMWTDINNIYTTYDGNRVEDNTHVGIFHEISYDAVIKNNTVRRNGFGKATWLWGPGILIAASPRVEVFGNTVEGNYNGITVVQQTRTEKASYGPHMVDDVWVHDNNVDMSAGGLTGFGQDVGDNSLYSATVVKFTGNHYTLGSSTRPFHWMNGTRTETEWKSYGEDQSGTFNR